jgi:hypothetical protein
MRHNSRLAIVFFYCFYSGFTELDFCKAFTMPVRLLSLGRMVELVFSCGRELYTTLRVAAVADFGELEFLGFGGHYIAPLYSPITAVSDALEWQETPGTGCL